MLVDGRPMPLRRIGDIGEFNPTSTSRCARPNARSNSPRAPGTSAISVCGDTVVRRRAGDAAIEFAEVVRGTSAISVRGDTVVRRRAGDAAIEFAEVVRGTSAISVYAAAGTIDVASRACIGKG
ncbi:MAG TPA: hypothetical protein VH143_13480 [Kofleriaceae bacterium]|nr:hypothetical protein [Kofleriaceae bacterium]